MTITATYNSPFDMTQWGILNDFTSGDFGRETSSKFVLFGAGMEYVFTGSDFTYDSNGVPTGGAITHLREVDTNSGFDIVQMGKFNLAADQLATFALTNDVSGFENAVLGSGGDWFNVGYHGATQHLTGTAGDDVFKFDGPDVAPADTFDGGGGTNTVIFGGNYGGALTVNPGMLENIQVIKIEGTFSDDLFLIDPNISGGKTLTVNAHGLGPATSITVFASWQTVNLNLVGGAGNDTLFGGTGDDQFTGGLGQDIFGGDGGSNTYIYHSAADSTGATYDAIVDFHAGLDHFQMPKTVNAIDPAITTGTLDYGANFDTELQAALKDHLNAGDAVLFTPDSGDLAGGTILVVDQNGHAGYQSGHDIVIELGNSDLTGFSTANFIT